MIEIRQMRIATDTAAYYRIRFHLETMAGAVYPGIADWLKRIAPEPNRYVYGAFMDKDLVGVVILKTSGLNAKLCHLSVLEDVRGEGIGYRLLQHAVDAIQPNVLRMTMPNSTWLKHARFFRYWKVEAVGPTLSNSREDDPELFCEGVLRSPPAPGRGSNG